MALKSVMPEPLDTVEWVVAPIDILGAIAAALLGSDLPV